MKDDYIMKFMKIYHFIWYMIDDSFLLFKDGLRKM